MALTRLRLPSIVVVAALHGLVALGCGLGGDDGPSTAQSDLPSPIDQPVDSMAHWDAFFARGYTYCDAKVLAGYWQVDTNQSKSKAGAMIAGGRPDGVEQALDSARPMASDGAIPGCAFDETGFSIADAELLAEAWGTTVTQAKATLALKATWGNTALAHQVLDDARAVLGEREGFEGGVEGQEDWVAHFLASDRVDTCHAHMLAAAWGVPLYEAKASLGYKIAYSPRSLEATLADIRSQAQADPAKRCTWAEVPWTYDDAVALAELWQVDTDQAKATVVQKYLYGNEGIVRDELRRAGRG